MVAAYKLNTAANVPIFMSSVTNILGGVNSITTVNLSKNGGTFSVISPTVTSMGLTGHYWLSLSAANMNTLGDIMIEASGLLSIGRVQSQIVAYDPNDAVALGLSNLDVAVSTRLASASFTAPDNAGIATLNTKLTTTRAGLLDNLNATITSRMATFTYTAPDNASISAILGRADVATSTRLAGSAYVAPDNTGVTALTTAVNGLAAKMDQMPKGAIFVQGKRYGTFV